jgi:hypothetical protein
MIVTVTVRTPDAYETCQRRAVCADYQPYTDRVGRGEALFASVDAARDAVDQCRPGTATLPPNLRRSV